jgi:DMSO/TMAO reductase YedYZ molybdopterin-dependent catalytic subunit
MGDALTYMAHRALLPGQSLAKEYQQGDISSFPATGTTNPGNPSSKYYSEVYGSLHKSEFADWRLSIEGKVARPGLYSLGDLQKLPSQKQITRHTCEEGWTAIAEWTGVPLSLVLKSAGILPTARFVNCYAYDQYMESIDMLDAFHPQTMLAYGMNGRNLPIPHGAPVRLRVETQVGYKSVKYLQRIVVTDEFVDVGDTGWSWYTGI